MPTKYMLGGVKQDKSEGCDPILRMRTMPIMMQFSVYFCDMTKKILSLHYASKVSSNNDSGFIRVDTQTNVLC